MAAAWVVPAFDEVKHGEARVGLGAEAVAIEQLALERREEALTHGVIIGVAHTAHRGPDTGRVTAPPEGQRRVLRKFNWSSQHWLCEPIVEPHRAPRPVFASQASFAAGC